MAVMQTLHHKMKIYFLLCLLSTMVITTCSAKPSGPTSVPATDRHVKRVLAFLHEMHKPYFPHRRVTLEAVRVHTQTNDEGTMYYLTYVVDVKTKKGILHERWICDADVWWNSDDRLEYVPVDPVESPCHKLEL